MIRSKKVYIYEVIMIVFSIICVILIVTSSSTIRVLGKMENENIKAFLMKSDDNSIGYVLSKEVGDKALEKLKKVYISSINIPDIKSIIIDNTITYVETQCSKNLISDEDELVNSIITYNNSNLRNIVSFTITTDHKAMEVMKSLNDVNKSFCIPVSGRITSLYGIRDRKMHNGVDIGASFNTNIVAVSDGCVKYSGYMKGYGNIIIIDHGNSIDTYYAHCSCLISNEGDYVKKGQCIARVGSTGDSTGPHLHFEIRNNGRSVDPLQYLSF